MPPHTLPLEFSIGPASNAWGTQIAFLKEAKEQVEKAKWEMISQKMLDLGCKKKIPGTTCEKKWKELFPQLNTQLQQSQGPNSASSDDTLLDLKIKEEEEYEEDD